MKLRNRTNQTQIINLDHEVVCGEGACLCSSYVHRSIELDGKTGETGVREMDRRVCASVHLLPKSTSDELPETVRDLAAVKDGVSRRELAIESTKTA